MLNFGIIQWVMNQMIFTETWSVQKVTELLNPNSSDYILDIACGNGNYSAYLAEKGISVVGFDYGEK